MELLLLSFELGWVIYSLEEAASGCLLCFVFMYFSRQIVKSLLLTKSVLKRQLFLLLVYVLLLPGGCDSGYLLKGHSDRGGQEIEGTLVKRKSQVFCLQGHMILFRRIKLS